MTVFDFDREIDRRAVPALKHHPAVLGAGAGTPFAAGVADMDFAVAPCVQAALARRLAHPVFGYEALPEALIAALIDWQRARHGWAVAADWVLRGPNVLNALSMAVCRFTDPGDGVIVQPPVFFDFFDIVGENGRRIVENPLIRGEDGRYAMDFDDLAAKAADPATRLLILCNPHNPIGQVWAPACLRRLGDICARHGVLVLSDEIHADLALPGHRHTPFAAAAPGHAANSVTCVSPAKSFNIAACAAAFTIVPDPGRRAALAAENSRLTVNKNNAFANVAMAAAWREGAAWLDAAIAYIAANAALYVDRLDRLPGVTARRPEAGFLVWTDFRARDLAPDALKPFLRDRAGWAVTSGAAFGTGGAGFVRVNIATPRPRLLRALDALERALANR
ncbi:MAG TPA: aminotransferase [Rhodobacteraceae bacterium]|jgi:cystathionine beta-lyase|nr:PatB family C-S lyase [Paracoccaceae bacterium]HBG99484.1 aminotransferase [Paracoccaceae bacterium]